MSDTGEQDEQPHEATVLLQEFLQLSESFTRMLTAELDVNATDFRAMEHLLRSGPLSPGELAKRLGLSGAALTTSVDRLTEGGHVRREPDSDDRRRVRVVPSPASSARASGFVAPMVRGLDQELDGFTGAERAVITEYLRRVVDAMRHHAEAKSTEPASRPADADAATLDRRARAQTRR